MESDDDFLSISDAENPPSPIPETRFKRLKKANSNKVVPLIVEATSVQRLNLIESEDSQDPNAIPDRSGSELDGFEEGNELDSGFDEPAVEENTTGVKRALDFDGIMETEKESEDLTVTEKKRRDLDGFEETKEKKKKKQFKNGDDGGHDDNSFLTDKRRKNKERRVRLKELRAESQRLLRETRDASFKPMPLVQKPVSSVLEKIRQRKLEVSKKLVITREVMLDFDFESNPVEDKENNGVEKANREEEIACPANSERSSDGSGTEGSVDTASPHHKDDSDNERKETFRAPVDDTQDLIFNSQTSDFKDELLDENPNTPLEEVLAPSLLAMNLKLDSAPLDDSVSDEEDNDKENIAPLLQKSIDSTSSPIRDPVKAFVEEEAEEEDDSDNDLGRFKDNEEDEDNIDSEEFNDMIATEYNEKPVDKDMRNHLHQKWLEQQDAAGTKNLLQRLKCGLGLREINLLDEKEDDECEEDEEDDEFLDEASDYVHPRNVVRMNLKKAKEMIPLMFTDKDDVYLSSDEETNKRHAKQHHSFKPEVHSTFVSPADDRGSKEIFGLIKKLNGVPDTRRQAKVASNFHMLPIKGKTTMSSKSSFLGRCSKNSLPSYQKHGSGTVRPFVFERDDSNSRSSIPMSEDSPDLSESKPRKTASAKFSSSQIRFGSQNTQTAAETKPGPSLHEILRCPSLQSSHRNRNSMVGQVEAIYAAFKLDQNMIKKERNMPMRTV